MGGAEEQGGKEKLPFEVRVCGFGFSQAVLRPSLLSVCVATPLIAQQVASKCNPRQAWLSCCNVVMYPKNLPDGDSEGVPCALCVLGHYAQISTGSVGWRVHRQNGQASKTRFFMTANVVASCENRLEGTERTVLVRARSLFARHRQRDFQPKRMVRKEWLFKRSFPRRR